MDQVGNLEQPTKMLKNTRMSPWRREQILRVIDGNQNLFVPLYHWSTLVRCDDILHWCLKNNVTGSSLSNFIQSRGILETAKEILRRVDRDTERRPIFADNLALNS